MRPGWSLVLVGSLTLSHMRASGSEHCAHAGCDALAHRAATLTATQSEKDGTIRGACIMAILSPIAALCRTRHYATISLRDFVGSTRLTARTVPIIEHVYALLAFQALVTFAVVPAALFNPSQAAIGVVCLVGVVLIEARVHTSLARALSCILGRHGRGKNGIARSSGSRSRSSRRGCRRGRFFLLLFRCSRCGGRFRGSCRCARRGSGWGRSGICPALRLAEVIPLDSLQRSRLLCSFILGTALLHCESVGATVHSDHAGGQR